MSSSSSRTVRFKRRLEISSIQHDIQRQYDELASFLQPGRLVYAYVWVGHSSTKTDDTTGFRLNDTLWNTVVPVSIRTVERFGMQLPIRRRKQNFHHMQPLDEIYPIQKSEKNGSIWFTFDLMRSQLTWKQDQTLLWLWNAFHDQRFCQHCGRFESDMNWVCPIPTDDRRPYVCHSCHRMNGESPTENENNNNHNLPHIIHDMSGCCFRTFFNQLMIKPDSEEPSFGITTHKGDSNGLTWPKFGIQLLLRSTQRYSHICQLIDHARIPENESNHLNESNLNMVIEFYDWISVGELWKEVFQYEMEAPFDDPYWFDRKVQRPVLNGIDLSFFEIPTADAIAVPAPPKADAVPNHHM